jgi:hypothetical protein
MLSPAHMHVVKRMRNAGGDPADAPKICREERV